MNKKRIIVLLLGFILLFSSAVLPQQEKKPLHAPNALPGVEPEMLTPEYWIGRMDDPDEVIMTPAEIERFNEKVRTKKVVFRERFGRPDPLERGFAGDIKNGRFMNPLLPLELPKTLPGDSLRVWLKDITDYLYSQDFYDNRNVTWSEDMCRKLLEKTNTDAIPDVITRRFGIIVNHVNMRLFPTSVPGYSDTLWELDRFQATGVCLGNPVAVLHQSLDGDFYYVQTPIARGWIASRDIALASKEKIRELVKDTNVLMATGHKIPVYSDPACRNFARYFYYSATMPLIRRAGTGFVVKMPIRATDGSLNVVNGYVKPDADVHVGHLPYTKRNVITQLFKLLNTPYGSRDANNRRSCSGTMRVLIRCFGIIAGRTPSVLLSAPDHQAYIDPSLSTEEKMAVAAKLEPFVTMAGSPGHIVLYIGKGHTGKLYFMHQAGWGYEDENGDHLFVNRTSINAADHSWYHINTPRVFATFRK